MKLLGYFLDIRWNSIIGLLQLEYRRSTHYGRITYTTLLGSFVRMWLKHIRIFLNCILMFTRHWLIIRSHCCCDWCAGIWHGFIILVRWFGITLSRKITQLIGIIPFKIMWFFWFDLALTFWLDRSIKVRMGFVAWSYRFIQWVDIRHNFINNGFSE